MARFDWSGSFSSHDTGGRKLICPEFGHTLYILFSEQERCRAKQELSLIDHRLPSLSLEGGGDLSD